jgi:hypothetical protein
MRVVLAAWFILHAAVSFAQLPNLLPLRCSSASCDRFRECVRRIESCDDPKLDALFAKLYQYARPPNRVELFEDDTTGTVSCEGGTTPPPAACLGSREACGSFGVYEGDARKTYAAKVGVNRKIVDDDVFCSHFIHEVTNTVQRFEQATSGKKPSPALCAGTPAASDPGDGEALENENSYRRNCTCGRLQPRCYYGCCGDNACGAQPPNGNPPAGCPFAVKTYARVFNASGFENSPYGPYVAYSNDPGSGLSPPDPSFSVTVPNTAGGGGSVVVSGAGGGGSYSASAVGSTSCPQNLTADSQVTFCVAAPTGTLARLRITTSTTSSAEYIPPPGISAQAYVRAAVYGIFDFLRMVHVWPEKPVETRTCSGSYTSRVENVGGGALVFSDLPNLRFSCPFSGHASFEIGYFGATCTSSIGQSWQASLEFVDSMPVPNEPHSQVACSP